MKKEATNLLIGPQTVCSGNAALVFNMPCYKQQVYELNLNTWILYKGAYEFGYFIAFSVCIFLTFFSLSRYIVCDNIGIRIYFSSHSTLDVMRQYDCGIRYALSRSLSFWWVEPSSKYCTYENEPDQHALQFELNCKDFSLFYFVVHLRVFFFWFANKKCLAKQTSFTGWIWFYQGKPNKIEPTWESFELTTCLLFSGAAISDKPIEMAKSERLEHWSLTTFNYKEQIKIRNKTKVKAATWNRKMSSSSFDVEAVFHIFGWKWWNMKAESIMRLRQLRDKTTAWFFFEQKNWTNKSK